MNEVVKVEILGAMQKSEEEEIKEMVSALLVIPKEERALLISGANLLKARDEMERIRKGA